MFKDCEADSHLRQTWTEFCDKLKDAGELIFRDTAPATPLDRATGLRYIARNISLALAFELENKDPLNPEFTMIFNPIRKQGGDNSDALYMIAPINGRDCFRVTGNRGSAAYIAISLIQRGASPYGGPAAQIMYGDELARDGDGSFELLISPEKQPGNWLKSTPETYRLTIRQFFGDWEHEEPMAPGIENLSRHEPPPLPTPEGVAQGLVSAANWLKSSTTFWADMLDLWQAQPNTFLSWRDLDDTAVDATPGGTPLICYWKVKKGATLIVRVVPPERCTFFNLEFGSYWFETIDYRYRHCALNSHSVVLEDDGSLTVLVAHEDPGFANWLEPAGHEEGYLTLRWMGVLDGPRPETQLVKASDLRSVLPENAKRATADDRVRMLEKQKRGLVRRFRTLG